MMNKSQYPEAIRPVSNLNLPKQDEFTPHPEALSESLYRGALVLNENLTSAQDFSFAEKKPSRLFSSHPLVGLFFGRMDKHLRQHQTDPDPPLREDI